MTAAPEIPADSVQSEPAPPCRWHEPATWKSEIPADVMAAAQRSALSWFATSEDGIYREPLTHFIARAILAERQRCVDFVSRRAGSVPHRQEIVAALLRGDVCDVFGSITQGPTT